MEKHPDGRKVKLTEKGHSKVEVPEKGISNRREIKGSGYELTGSGYELTQTLE